MKEFIIGLALVFLLSSNSFAIDYKKTSLLIAYSGISYVGTVAIHESGHYIFAKSFVSDVEMNLFSVPSNISYNGEGLSRNQENLIHIGGITGTRTISESIDGSGIDSRLFSTLYLFTRLDMPRYVFGSALVHWINPSWHTDGSDINQLVESFSHRKDEQNLIYVSLAVLMIIDLYLDRKEIKRHFSRIFR